jgi:integral membrane protein
MTQTGAFKLFRIAAWVVGTVLAFMTVVGLPWKYLLGNTDSTWYSLGWQLHGLLFMVYIVTVLDLAIKARWSPLKAVLVALAGTIPFMSFVAEAKVHRELQGTPAPSTPARSPR